MSRELIMCLMAAIFFCSCSKDDGPEPPVQAPEKQEIQAPEDTAADPEQRMPKLAAPSLDPKKVQGKIKYIKRPDGGTMPLLLLTPAVPDPGSKNAEGEDKAEKSQDSTAGTEDKK